MRNRLFQYQALAQPLPTDAETPTPDKWLPQMPPPVRRPAFRNRSVQITPVEPVAAVTEAAVESWMFRQDMPVRRLPQRPAGFIAEPWYFEPALPPAVAPPLPPLTIAISYPDSVELGMAYSDTVELTIGDAMLPPEVTMRWIRARDFTIRARFTKPRTTTDWTVSFTVRDALSGSAVITKTIGLGITEVNGGFDVAIAKANTSGLTPSRDLDDDEGYVFDLTRTNEGSNVTLARGQIILDREVTS